MQQTRAVPCTSPPALDSNASLGWRLHGHLPRTTKLLAAAATTSATALWEFLHGMSLACACRKALLEKGGLEIWAKVVKGALRSSAFLGMYCTLCWRGACVGFQTTKSCSPPVIAASCWTGEHVQVHSCAGHD